MASSIENFGLVHALTPQAASDYKALVCLFMNGGNDGNNMFVSLDQYASYSSARNAAGLAIPQASLLPVSPVSGGSYGFHPNMPEVKALFDAGKLAVLCNNGPLVEPLTKTTWENAVHLSRNTAIQHGLLRLDAFQRFAAGVEGEHADLVEPHTLFLA